MANLSPDVIARLLASAGNPTGSSYTANGTTYAPMYANTGDNNNPGTSLQGFASYGGGTSPGDPYSMYDASGNYVGARQFQNGAPISDFLIPLMAAIGMGMVPGAAGAGMSGDATAAGYDPLFGAAPGGATGSSLATGAGTGAASMAGDATAAGYDPLFGAAADGAAPAGGSALATMNSLPLMDTGSLATIPGAMSAGGGLFAGLAGSGLLGPALSVLGAAAGSQGQKQTQTKTMDPRFDPYYFGANGQGGLLPYTQQLLQQQMSPGAMAGYDQMKQTGQRLMSQPVAGNGFSLFSGGR